MLGSIHFWHKPLWRMQVLKLIDKNQLEKYIFLFQNRAGKLMIYFQHNLEPTPIILVFFSRVSFLKQQLATYNTWTGLWLSPLSSHCLHYEPFNPYSNFYWFFCYVSKGAVQYFGLLWSSSFQITPGIDLRNIIFFIKLDLLRATLGIFPLF